MTIVDLRCKMNMMNSSGVRLNNKTRVSPLLYPSTLRSSHTHTRHSSTHSTHSILQLQSSSDSATQTGSSPHKSSYPAYRFQIPPPITHSTGHSNGCISGENEHLLVMAFDYKRKVKQTNQHCKLIHLIAKNIHSKGRSCCK